MSLLKSLPSLSVQMLSFLPFNLTSLQTPPCYSQQVKRAYGACDVGHVAVSAPVLHVRTVRFNAHGSNYVNEHQLARFQLGTKSFKGHKVRAALKNTFIKN